MKNRILAFLLCATLILAVLSGCTATQGSQSGTPGRNPATHAKDNDSESKPSSGGITLSDLFGSKPQPETPEEPEDPDEPTIAVIDPEPDEPEAPEEPVEPALQNPGEPDTVLHAWELKSEEEAREYLCGDWTLYVADLHAEMCFLSLYADGSYDLSVIPEEHLWDEDPASSRFYYCGDWDVFFLDDPEVPYALSLGLSETNDSFFEGWGSIGDFAIQEITYCDGQLVTYPIQLNNGESVLSERIGLDREFLLTQDTERELSAERHMDDTFYAQSWKILYGYNIEPGEFGAGRFVVFLDDIQVDEEGYARNDLRESVPYIVSDNADETASELSGGWDGLDPYGDVFWLITTDASGEIVHVEFIPTDLAPSPEEAMQVLEYYPEVQYLLEIGYSWACLGTEYLFEENSTIIGFGEESDGVFDPEYLYAVNSSGQAFCMNSIDGCWYWMDEPAEDW